MTGAKSFPSARADPGRPEVQAWHQLPLEGKALPPRLLQEVLTQERPLRQVK